MIKVVTFVDIFFGDDADVLLEKYIAEHNISRADIINVGFASGQGKYQILLVYEIKD